MPSKTPINYAIQSCETMMRKFKNSPDLPPKKRFHYHQGVFLSGMYKTYEICKDEKYFNYIKTWLDSVIDENGSMEAGQDGIQMDDMQPGILCYPMMDRSSDSRYENAIKMLMKQFETYPKNKIGGLWHKDRYPNQMWLDGLYMGGPIQAEYAKRFNSPTHTDFVINQIKLMCQNTKDPITGLWYHAWDESREVPWCDKETGLSAEFWGRSIGWVPVAILDVLDFVCPSHPEYNNVVEILKDLIKAICKYQSADGRWYQVVDKGGKEGNWLETSCSSLFVAAICKAVRKGLLCERYMEYAKKGFDGVINSLEYDGDDILINNVCIGTGVGDYKHYCDRPISINDLHGVGAFLIMCAEAELGPVPTT